MNTPDDPRMSTPDDPIDAVRLTGADTAPTAHDPAPGNPAAGDEPLARALTDVIRAQRLIEAFYCRARSMLREVEVALLGADPALHVVDTGAYEIFSPTPLSLHHPAGWLRRWLGLFFAEPRFLPPHEVDDCRELKLAYLLLNLDPQSVCQAELDLVVLSSFSGLSGALATWLPAVWHRGQFELNVPADGWYGPPDPVDLGYGASMRLQLRRVPLVRVPDRGALQREVIDRLLRRWKELT